MKALPFAVNTFPLVAAHYVCWFRLLTRRVHGQQGEGRVSSRGRERTIYLRRSHGIPG